MATLPPAQRIRPLLDKLRVQHPNARYELDFENPLQLLVATILAAQCTDERVNRVTPGLFRKYPNAAAFADADIAELEEDLKPTGFFRQKAKTVKGVCQALRERHGGQVPADMDALTALPGVARKSANVVLNTGFRIASGVIVDVHVARVTQRMGLTRESKPERIEEDMMRLVPKDEWVFFGPAMVLHGRYTCTAKKPQCPTCPMQDLCDKIDI